MGLNPADAYNHLWCFLKTLMPRVRSIKSGSLAFGPRDQNVLKASPGEFQCAARVDSRWFRGSVLKSLGGMHELCRVLDPTPDFLV